MNKKTRSIVVLFALAAGTLVTLATSPASPVKAEPTETPALYKITAQESESTPIGCTGCQPSKTNVPVFEAQTQLAASLSSATKIDTYTVNTWDQVTQKNLSFDGGCAIISAGLQCWGNNNYGQLGNESTTSSTSATVTATDGGVAITNVTEVSTNGKTLCVVSGGALKCVGVGNFPGTSTTRTDSWFDTRTITSGAEGENSRTELHKLETFKTGVTEPISSVTDTKWVSEQQLSSKWITLIASGVKKVQVGTGNQGGSNSTPDICVLTTTGLASCAVVAAAAAGASTSSNRTEVDCAKNGTWVVGTCTETSYNRRFVNVNTTVTPASVWEWKDTGETGVLDISLPSDSWGAANICLAGAKTTCFTFSGGVFGTKNIIEGGDVSEAVYVSSAFGLGLCVYASGTVSCGVGASGPTGQSMATKVSPVAVMAKPLGIFNSSIGTMQKLYFQLPSGILSADSWIFSCTGCPESSKVVTPVGAFKASTESSFTYATKMNGATDNANFIPMSVVTGTRKLRSSVALSVKTESGQVLSGVSVRWNAPDAPGTLMSSASSTLTTDETGAARTTVTSGPVTFTLSVSSLTVCPPICTNSAPTTTTTVAGGTISLKPAGSLSTGATLQAASVTVIVGETGTVTITVPDPPAIVSRKISVTLPDGTPVPTATVQLKNNYLTYAYQNSGTSTSTWSSRPRDAKGYLGQMNCAYCFVAPPKYATGVDGSVTFPSFNPSARSSAYDADVAYDDGELNQNKKWTFTSLTETVPMSFMASIKATLPDADPTTPAKETDADPSTPETDIKADSTGGVTIETDLVDEDKAPISGVSQSVEPVNSGSSCEQGGLVGSTDKVSTICANGGVSTSSINKAAIVRAMRVKTSAGCSAMMVAKTGSNGKATLVICPSSSTKYRVRGTGAIASKTICVRVNNVACGVSSTSVNTGTNTGTYTPTSVVSKVAVMKKGKVTSFTSINKTAKVNVPKGAKVVLVVAVTTKKFCSISGTSVKALKAGTCSISVRVTPKATAKVKKPKTTTTKIKIKVT
jgi:hypothetical protein